MQYCQVEFNVRCSVFSTEYGSPHPNNYIANVFLQQTNQRKNTFQQGEAHFLWLWYGHMNVINGFSRD